MLPKRLKIGKLLILTLSVGAGLVVSLSAVMGITESDWWREQVGGNDAEETQVASAENGGVTPGSGQVMGVTDEGFFTADSLVFRIATSFEDVLTARVLEVDERLDIAGEVNLSGPVTIANDITAQGSTLDLGAGTITASNIVYSLQGESGEVVLVAGDGVTIDGLTISNADRGSTQNIFKNIKIGSDTISADDNDDTFTLSGGTGVTLSSSGSTITFSSENLSGWNRPSSGVVSLITAGDKVGIGTANPSSKLELDSGTSGVSGLEFTRLTSASSVGVGGGKVLSVDSGGKVILVSDQTVETAEEVLPSADEGGTLFFNGTNWASTTNLYHNDGEVGISTTNPQGRFHLNTNDATKIGAIFQAESSQTANLMEWRNSAGSILSYIDSDGIFNGSANVEGSINPGLTEGYVTFQGANGITGSNNLFWDNDTGRLGIGTTSPGYKLHVLATSDSDQSLRFDEGQFRVGVDPNGDRYINMTNSATTIFNYGGVNILGPNNGEANVNIRAGSHSEGRAGYVKVDGNTWGYVRIDTGDLERLRVTNSGNVGIGTTAPTSRLHLDSATTGKALAIFNETGDQNVLTASSSGSTVANLTNTGTLELSSGTAAAPAFTFIDDTDTGLYRIGADTLGFSVGGTAELGLSSTALYPTTAEGLVLGSSTAEFNALYLGDDQGTYFGLDQDFHLYYDETTDDRLELSATNKDFYMGLGTGKLHVAGTSEQLRLAYDASNYTSFTVDSLGNLTFADSGTSIATFGQSQAAFDVPVAFNNAGDVAVANDLNFTNITASYVTSDSPLYIQAGNAAESESLYLSSAGSGAVYVDDDLYITSVLYGSDGTAAAPSLSFENDTDTGLFSANSNTELGFAVGGSERVRIDSDGNVGIGTTAPSDKLVIDGGNLVVNPSNEFILKQPGNGGNSIKIRKNVNHNFVGVIEGAAHNGTTGYPSLGLVFSSAGNFGIGTDDNASLFRITNDGKIGIGTTNPGGEVHITRSATATSVNSNALLVLDHTDNSSMQFLDTGGNSTQSLIFSTNGNENGAISYSHAANDSLNFKVNGNTRMIIDHYSIGIGTTTPTSLLHLDSSNTATFGKSLAIFNHDESQDILTASASGTTKFVVDESGNTFVGNLDTSSTSAVCFESATKNGAALNKLTDCNGSPADLAEYYPAASHDTEDSADDQTARSNSANLPEPGDIVSIGEPLGTVATADGTSETYFNVTKSTKAYDSKMLGIVSTKAHTIMGEDVLEWAEHAVAVGLTGRVPVKIDPNSEPIKAGDFITSSSEPGLGQKAEDNGYTIGKALEDWSCEKENGSLKYPHLCTDTIMVTLNQSVHMSEEAITAAASPENEKLSTSTENDVVLNSSINSLVTFDGDDALISTAGTLKFQGESIQIDANGNLKITKGVIYGNDSFRGQETVEAGKSEIKVERSWESAPVSVTATAQFDSYVWIEDLSKDGFTIKIKDAPDEEAKVFWTAIW